MPSKLRKAIGAMKDQTSISLAKVSSTNASNLEVLILKATTHDEVPIDDRYTNEILQLVASNKAHAAVCAQVIGKRIGKTRNWIVALKSLMLILRVFQDGDPYFPREILHAMKRGHKILNLSSFRDDSNSSPWDYTAFVRTFALYLDERLDCFLTGKLQRRFSYKDKESNRCKRSYSKPVCDMKPPVLLDKISYWQRLLDRAIGTRPTGAAKSNKLVQISIYAVVQESFDLYRDISDGLALLLDSFFHLQYQNCVSAFQSCVRASKQFEELCSFYDLCKSLNVGRTSEYPSVQKISEELVETLQEFLKDQASFPANGRSPPLPLPRPTVKDAGSSSDHQSWDQISSPDPTTERNSEYGSEFGSQCEFMSQSTSYEDLMSGGTSPSTDHYSNSSEKKYLQVLDTATGTNTGSNYLVSKDLVTTTDMSHARDMVLFSIEDKKQDQEDHKMNDNKTASKSEEAKTGNWETELEIFGTSSNNPPLTETNLPEAPVSETFFGQDISPRQQHYNPFLVDDIEIPASVSSRDSLDETATLSASNDLFSVAPIVHTAGSPPPPTFSAGSSEIGFESEDDPFGVVEKSSGIGNGSVDEQIVLQERELWLQNQNKIIAKHTS